MATDLQLDQFELNQVIYDYDTRFGTGPAVIASYQHYVNEWTAVLAEVQGWCQDPPKPISTAQRGEAAAWFAFAIAAHQADSVARPDDRSWNDQWIANYTRLTGLFSS